jgi:nicotinic acid mononucleotide adenylyltransferase
MGKFRFLAMLGLSSALLFAEDSKNHLLESADSPVLAFGGSFSPPTIEHMSILTSLMARFNISQGRLLVTMPYKASAAPADVSLGLSQLAVEKLDEILELNSLHFREFQKISKGHSRWVGPEERHFEVLVDDYDIKTQNKENTLKTLNYLSTASGGAKNLFWVSGGDSFASVPTWTPQWRELFDSSHWVVISRSDVKNAEQNILFGVENPLRGHFPDEFLENYNYSFDAEERMHIYKNKDSAKPNIYIIDIPSLGDSSSKNRASLSEKGDHEHAQQGLQPSVFKECVEKGYFLSEGSFKVLSERNLNVYIEWLFSRLQRSRGHEIQSDDEIELRRLTSELLKLAQENLRVEKNKNLANRMFVALVDKVFSYLTELKQIHLIGEKIREISKEYKVRNFAAVFLLFEVLELTLGPVFLTHYFGPEGLVALPFFHPNEILVGGGFVVWNLYRKISERRRLAGDLETYKSLTNYRNRLMRGDPDAIQIRVKLRDLLGLGGVPIEYHVVKSRLPRFLPLLLRNWDDRRVRWYDLNVSTNELVALLGNKELSKYIKKISNKDQALYAYLLNAAVYENQSSALSLELFLGRRYFKRLYLARLPVELLSTLSESERSFYETIKQGSERFLLNMDSQSQEILGELVSDFYLLKRFLELKPETLNQTLFWEKFIDLMVSSYPGIKANLKNHSVRKKVILRLKFSLLNLQKEYPEFFRNFKINHYGETLLEFKDSQLILAGDFSKSKYESLSRSWIEIAAESYIVSLGDVFKLPKEMPPISQNAESFKLLPNLENNTEQRGNLYFEMLNYRALQKKNFDTLEQGFERAREYLSKRIRHPKADRVFKQSLIWIERDFDSLLDEMRELEFEILKLKYTHQLSLKAEDEASLPGFMNFRQRFEEIQGRIDYRLKSLREINQMMNAIKAVRLENLEDLREDVSRVLQMSSGEARSLGQFWCSLSLL